MRARHLRVLTVLAAIALAALELTFVVGYDGAMEERRRADFEVEVDRTAAEIAVALERVGDKMRAVAAFFVSSELVAEQEFAAFVDRMGLFADGAPIRAVAVAPILTAKDLPRLNAALEARASVRADLGYATGPPAAAALSAGDERRRLMPVVYAEAPEGRAGIVGFDIASSAARAAAVDRAAASGAPQITGPVVLSQDRALGDAAPKSLLMVAVAERGDLGLLWDDIGVDRPIALAMSLTPERALARLIKPAHQGRLGLDLRDLGPVGAIGPAATPTPMASLSVAAPPGAFETVRRLEIGGRVWEIAFTAGPDFMRSGARWGLYGLAAAALALLIFSATAVDFLIRRRELLARRVEERTAQLTVLNEQLLAAAQRANDASQAKSEFLANMSHELRTPLNALIGFSEVIKEEVHGPLGHAKYREYAADMQSAGGHLLTLINDILDLARVEAGRVELEEAPDGVDLAAVAESCLRLTEPAATQAGVRVRMEAPDDLPRLSGDPRLVRQILLNLLSNAIRYNRRGGSVRVGLAQSPRSTGRPLDGEARALAGGLVLIVEDDGPGIPPAELERVLEPFAQARGSQIAAPGGVGLGLALVRRLVALHGGRFSIENRDAGGVRATVRFPGGRTRSTAPKREETEASRS
ncbi:MAG: ATP-binding protein [Marivibrio sp.]|uniref:ATP-binding protein n=1 Tax=Marivibrio sp. TaxID=2039719 RepID=UPI0032EC54DB